MKTYMIDNISNDDIEIYRERSVRAINGIRLLYNEPSIIVNKSTIYGKYLTIAKYIGLTTENNKSAYNHFVPINTNIIFVLRLSDHDNKNPSLYDIHEKMGRPNRRQIICFSDGEIMPKDEEWNGSKHVVVPYGINALDNEESVISFLNALVKLFYDGDSSFPILPLVNNNNDESSNDVVHDWNKTVDKITENKQNTKMKTNNRNVVRLTESQLKQMIAESVKNVLNESVESGLHEDLSDIIRNLKLIANSAYIPFTSPSPSSTESVVKNNVKKAIELLEYADIAVQQLSHGVQRY